MSRIWQIPIYRQGLADGAAFFLSLLASPTDEVLAREFYEALWSFVIREGRRRGHFRGDARASDLLARVKTQQMDNRLRRLRRLLVNRTIARDLIIGGCIKPINIPIAGGGAIRLVVSKAAVRPTKKVRRDPNDIQRDRFWADAKGRNPSTAGPAPAGFVGTVGSHPTVANYVERSEDVTPALSAVIREAARQLKISERNFRRDYLNPVRPVLHMADALWQFIGEVDRNDRKAGREADLGELLWPQNLILSADLWLVDAMSKAVRFVEWWPSMQHEFPALRWIDGSGFLRLMPLEEPEPAC